MPGRVVLPSIILAVVLTGAAGGSARGAPVVDGRIDDQSMRQPRRFLTPEVIVRRVVEAGGDAYAGDCVATVSPQDIGKVCSTFVAERGEVRAYLVGRTFSEYDRWVFVRRWGRGWRAAGIVPLDFFAPSLQIPWPR